MSAHSCPAIWLAVTKLKVANEASKKYLSHPAYCQCKPTRGTLTDIPSRIWNVHVGQSVQGLWWKAAACIHHYEYANSWQHTGRRRRWEHVNMNTNECTCIRSISLQTHSDNHISIHNHLQLTHWPLYLSNIINGYSYMLPMSVCVCVGGAICLPR